MPEAKTHARKVARQLGAGLICLPGQQTTTWEDSDMGPAFRQRRYFYYIAGVDFPGAVVTYEMPHDYLILWIPLTDAYRALWHGSTPGPDECKAVSDVDEVRYIGGLDRYLTTCRALTPGSNLYVLHADQTPRMDGFKGIVRIDTVSLQPAMNAARVIKTDYEVAMIKRANAISGASHKAVMTRLKRLSNEREVEAIFCGVCRAHGAKNQAYPVIAGSGPNASTLHYDSNDQPLEGRQLLCLDAGAEWKCYASDITRTMPLSGTFSTEAAEVHAIVTRMQEECFKRVVPGVTFASLHVQACIVAVQELLRLGVLAHGTADEILARGTVAGFFPHGLGHHVGLEVHDPSGPLPLLAGCEATPRTSGVKAKSGHVTDQAAARMWREHVMAKEQRPEMMVVPVQAKQRLEKNMVVTVEPGIYFCRPYLEEYFLRNPDHAKYVNKVVLERYYPVGGVRIEDCIVITNNGYDNLTSAPKGDDMLKIINSGF
ncbi:putative xaa-pro dipeptidase protein [Podospora conica]|nr:putative xaa-pro dipeptidase protein [Schizothecium conicum]